MRFLPAVVSTKAGQSNSSLLIQAFAIHAQHSITKAGREFFDPGTRPQYHGAPAVRASRKRSNKTTPKANVGTTGQQYLCQTHQTMFRQKSAPDANDPAHADAYIRLGGAWGGH